VPADARVERGPRRFRRGGFDAEGQPRCNMIQSTPFRGRGPMRQGFFFFKRVQGGTAVRSGEAPIQANGEENGLRTEFARASITRSDRPRGKRKLCRAVKRHPTSACAAGCCRRRVLAGVRPGILAQAATQKNGKTWKAAIAARDSARALSASPDHSRRFKQRDSRRAHRARRPRRGVR